MVLQYIGAWLCPCADLGSFDVCGGCGAVNAIADFVNDGTNVGAATCCYGC